MVRLDGRSFHKFSKTHHFQKPNDSRALQLMNQSAAYVVKEIEDLFFAYGQSDEYSFVFKKNTKLWGRREAKLTSNLCSLFTSYYVLHWKSFFDIGLQYPPSFDARAVCYPCDGNLRDYLSWRQADCHINNLYNTTFWNLVLNSKQPMTEQEAQLTLKGTDSGAKNEILFSQFGINYAKIDPIYRKGSIVYYVKEEKKKMIAISHEDIIQKEFWEKTNLLALYS